MYTDTGREIELSRKINNIKYTYTYLNVVSVSKITQSKAAGASIACAHHG